MYDEIDIPNSKLESLAKQLSKTFCIDEEEAMSLVYDEWDIAEELFHTYANVKTVHQYFIEEINATYGVA